MRQEVGHVGQLRAACELGKDIGKMLDGVDVGECTAAENRVGDRSSLRARIGASKQVCLARQGNSKVILPYRISCSGPLSLASRARRRNSRSLP